eukprot:NODE_12279_length_283_cov_8.884615_g11366_i0.p1 GENE.NODE_12279_length_283_cov_8.884615_g11366_i0~~NODE_12279_length_283_cov_8.884615_g11366_i0.p1  ORF type:complete len:53 (+),score=4.81 NODE_12279_length_283_cov_8.884615_g11366_i0:69-227(+)
MRYGDTAAVEVQRAAVELDVHNPSGFYPVTLPWDFRQGRELTPAEVIRLLSS